MMVQAIALPSFFGAIDNTNNTEKRIHKRKVSQLAASHKRQFMRPRLESQQYCCKSAPERLSNQTRMRESPASRPLFHAR
jgi:hypothetical protein